MTIDKILRNPYLNLISRLIIGVLLIYAAVSKISDPHLFAKEISNYGIMIDSTINLMALVLPWIELFVGAFLILGLNQKASALISGFLMIVFILAIGIAMIKGLDINCGCFGTSITKVGWGKLAEDFGLLILSAYIYFYPNDTLSLSRLFPGKVESNE